MNYRFPLALSTWGDEEINAMHRVINSGKFTMGENVAEFQRQFANYIGSRYCVMVNSGSSANLLMIAALFYTTNESLKLQAGDEVVVPAVSWSTSYAPLYQYGLKMTFVDIDMDTLNYDLDQLESSISDNTKAILAVNLLGNPNDFDRIKTLSENHGIVLIEDNCESMGAEYNGKKTGTFGVMGSFSTFFSHHISTMEGGIIATDDEELYHILLSLRAHGWTRDLPDMNHVCTRKSMDAFHESFRFVLPGYNVRPIELSGAIGIEQLKKLPAFVEQRVKNATELRKILGNHPEILIQREIGRSSWFGFSMILRPNSSFNREYLLSRLNEMSFEARPIVTGNFINNEVVKYYDCQIPYQLKNAEYIDKNGLFIGNHHVDYSDSIKSLSEII